MARFELDTDTLRRHPLGPTAQQILSAALEAVDPRAAVARWARAHLDPARRVWVLGAGKAAASMTRGLLDAAAASVAGGLIVVKHDDAADLGPVESMHGSHPIPDARSVEAGARLLEVAAEVPPDDAVIAVISGGASSLIVAPPSEDALAQLQQLTRQALGDATPIAELNAQRRALDRIKAGGLARAIDPRVDVHALVLSDVIGSGPHTVGSGPLDDPRVQLTVLGDNATAVRAAATAAEAAGLEVDVGAPMLGIARHEGVALARHVLMRAPSEAVRCTIVGGETRVELVGEGRGGRNQELALAAAPQLLGHPHALLVTLATDGEDGPTDAAGAVVDGQTVVRALELGLDPMEHLQRNDAYPLFDALGDLLRPGPTGTNVCDLTLMLS